MKALSRCAFAALALLFCGQGRSGEPGRTADVPMKFVFFADTKPVLIDLQARIDGKPATKLWSDYFRRWFDLLDRDHDGVLNAKEAEIAPADDLLLQVMRQGNFFGRGGLTGARIPAPGSRLSFDDFLRYYAKKVGPYQLSGPSPTLASAPNSTLVQQWLDRNKDGVITVAEVTAAAGSFDALDKDDDEIITAQELGAGPAGGSSAGGFVVFGGPPTVMQTTGSDAFLKIDEASRGKMALLLLSNYDRDRDKALSQKESGLPNDAFGRLDADGDGKLGVEELAHWDEQAAQMRIVAQMGRDHDQLTPRVAAPFAVRDTADASIASIGDAQITIKTEQGQPAQNITGRILAILQQQFKVIAKGEPPVIEKKDAQGNPIFASIFSLADANDDGKMTEEELRPIATLLEAAPNCFATIAVVEQGRAFFQILDANRDSRLSVRELRSAWSRLEEYDTNKDGAISEKEIARQFSVSVQRGQNSGGLRTVDFAAAMRLAPNTRPSGASSAPLWFQRMDRNADGDISVREFLGTAEQFQRLDTDGDGLISTQEASKAGR